MDESSRSSSLQQLMDAVLTISTDLDLPAMLRRIIQCTTELVDAQYGALGVLDDSRTRLSEFITVGIDEQGRRQIGELPQGHGILGTLILDAQPLRLPDLRLHPDSYGFPPNHPPMRSFLGVPIRVRDTVFGNLYLTDKRGADEFSDLDEELVVALSAAAGVAIENARLHLKVNDLAVLEDRERIARDLHDTVIQRLFATGMSLQGSVRLVQTDPAAAVHRIEGAVDDLDLTVKHIRTAIFGLEASRPIHDSTRTRILALVHQAIGALGFEPRVLLDGPVDTGMDDGTAAELIATLREGLSNVARHAHASRVDIEVVFADDIRLTIADDGVGPPGPDVQRGRGLANMEARAKLKGGSFTLRAADPQGTVLEWRVPK